MIIVMAAKNPFIEQVWWFEKPGVMQGETLVTVTVVGIGTVNS